MTTTRRNLLKGLALGTLPFSRKLLDTAETSGSGEALAVRPFASWSDALDAPCSKFIGMSGEGISKNGLSRYSGRSTQPEVISFDVSNQQILCSVNRHGLLERACILAGLVRMEAGERLPGNFADKVLVRGGLWPLRLGIEGMGEVNLERLPRAEVQLLGNLFPSFTAQHQHLRFRLLFFAPMKAENALTSPRAVIAVLEIRNTGAAAATAAPLAPAALPNVDELDPDKALDARQAFMFLDEASQNAHSGEAKLQLRPGERRHVALAFLVGESARELKQTGARLSQRTALDWLNQTWEFHAARLGRLEIPDEPFYAESFGRMEELCRQSVMRMRDGSFGGGFWGSDVAKLSAIWNKDNFHAMLPMSLLEPRLCADSILFFFQHGMPPQPYGRGLARFPNARRVTHSLANALAPLVLAGAYYQMTADRDFFRAHPEILPGAQRLLQEILDSRRETAFLFPSMYISDGDSRGDFHTGSNLLVWYAFQNIGRIAREAYGESGAGEHWQSVAAKVKEDLWRHCSGVGPLGKQFFEGATRDWTFLVGHDGEESDTTLMPFYGFCEADEPALLNHARLALTPQNPYYAAGVDGIWWYGSDKWQPATFPAWTTALAGAENESEQWRRLDHIRRMADVDGSIWWWPYKYGSTDPNMVLRGPGKCGWAAGVYLCLFVHNILGLRLDMPARTISFRPFCPWPRFSWRDCHLGSGIFDFVYERQRGGVSGEIVNRSKLALDGMIELMLPTGSTAGSCSVNGNRTTNFSPSKRYNSPSVRTHAELGPGRGLRVQIVTSGPS